MYSVLLVVMLLAQAVVAAALFTDKSWRRYLPPDETGEVKKVCAASCFTAESNVLRRFGHISDHLQRKTTLHKLFEHELFAPSLGKHMGRR